MVAFRAVGVWDEEVICLRCSPRSIVLHRFGAGLASSGPPRYGLPSQYSTHSCQGQNDSRFNGAEEYRLQLVRCRESLTGSEPRTASNERCPGKVPSNPPLLSPLLNNPLQMCVEFCSVNNASSMGRTGEKPTLGEGMGDSRRCPAQYSPMLDAID